MYQWTHIELARNQPNGNGPKTDYDDEKVQKQSDQEESNYDNNNSTVIVASEERGESFATVKNQLLLCESTTKISKSDTENHPETEQKQIENGETQHGSVEESQNCIDGMDGHLKNEESLQQNCDNVDKIFVEISTQTDNEHTLADIKEKKKSEDSQTRPPPPPPPLPPPPSPLPSICIVPSNEATDESVNEKPAVTANTPASADQIPVTPQQNSQINISSTKLSSASSFCPPPPPPMNGVPGPPPLPLPTGNLWFKSDSKYSILLGLLLC